MIERGSASERNRAGTTRLASALVLWIALAAPLHLAWEWAHAPLYTLWVERSRALLTYSIAHCTAGDALIAGVSYLAGAACSRAADWPHAASVRGLAATIVAGVGYTTFSEWLNVYRLGSWAYTDAMPLLGGIGVTPLLQWAIVPVAVTLLWRACWRGDRLERAVPAR